ncbi:uncharacterized protein LOC121385960 [Gigantopelta aegis]|uniref:uncharacterized protein LOC121385960 n=1 Tax=Gigantopelta aegis TaxID=1735272 RepID=UPI001B88C955|nr:uncharacterized protein LOC121385960 [Gigantopelta aegis]
MPKLWFHDDGSNLTMREFYEQHQNNLPRLAIVTQGFDGGVELDTLGIGQVMRIQGACKQKRAVAIDGAGRNITIPLDYPLKFRFYKRKKKDVLGQNLGEIVRTHALPVQLEFVCSEDYRFDVCNTQASVKSFGKLTVSKVYDETYLIANTIQEGVFELHTILVPLYLQKVLVSTVVGIKDQTSEQFRDFVCGIEDAATRTIYDGKTGNENIAMYNQADIDESKSENVYELLEPASFFKITRPVEENTGEYSTLQVAAEETQPRAKTTGARKITQSTSCPPQKVRVPEVPPRTIARRKVPPAPRLLSPDYNRTEQIQQPGETSITGETTQSTNRPIQHDSQFLLPQKSNLEGFMSSSQQPRPLPSPIPQKDDGLRGSKTAPPLPERDPLQQPERATLEEATNRTGNAYVNAIERAVVAPYVASTSSQSAVRAVGAVSAVSAVGVVSTEEKRADELTIGELAVKMKRLRLDRHVDSFRKEGIDGYLLCKLTKNILAKEFSFTELEIIKLMAFIETGHIPQ